MKIKPTDRYLPEHDASNPDPRPGHYYVSAIDGGTVHRMAGPFPTHAESLELVKPVREFAESHDGRAHFMGWGTIRLPLMQDPPPGNLDRLGVDYRSIPKPITPEECMACDDDNHDAQGADCDVCTVTP
jgi:hypothetical protein